MGSPETHDLRSDFGPKADPSDTCTLIFGIWDPHYKSDKDKAAMVRLMKKSLWAGVETSAYAKNWLDTTAKVCEKGGLKLVKDEDADCREALKGEKPDTSILRHMKFFERKNEGKNGDSLSTASESSEHEENEEDEEQASSKKSKQ